MPLTFPALTQFLQQQATLNQYRKSPEGQLNLQSGQTNLATKQGNLQLLKDQIEKIARNKELMDKIRKRIKGLDLSGGDEETGDPFYQIKKQIAGDKELISDIAEADPNMFNKMLSINPGATTALINARSKKNLETQRYNNRVSLLGKKQTNQLEILDRKLANAKTLDDYRTNNDTRIEQIRAGFQIQIKAAPNFMDKIKVLYNIGDIIDNIESFIGTGNLWSKSDMEKMKQALKGRYQKLAADPKYRNDPNAFMNEMMNELSNMFGTGTLKFDTGIQEPTNEKEEY